VDVSITHPLAPSLGLDLQAAKQALRNKASRKKAKYAALVADRKLNFIPFLMSTFGAFEEEDAVLFLDKVAGFYAAKQQVPAAECKNNLIQLLQIAVLKDVARRLLAATLAVEEAGQEDDLRGATSNVAAALFSEGGFSGR
jgi:hypothetical protein